MLSLAAQLIDHFPEYAETLVNHSDGLFLSVKSEIKAENINNSRIQGVVIDELHTRSPKETLNKVLCISLENLPKKPERPILIVIDSLDEAITYNPEENLVTLLTEVQDLPDWVRFLFTSRFDDRVLSFVDKKNSLFFHLDEEFNQSDICEYVTTRVESEEIQRQLKEFAVEPQTLVDRLSEPSNGNFLYTKLLLDEIKSGNQPLDNLDALPKGLSGIYHEFLRRRCSDDEWANKYQPILGTLAVTQAPINRQQLKNFTNHELTQIQNNLKLLSQFLDIFGENCSEDETYALFHQSFQDYLLQEYLPEEDLLSKPIKRRNYFYCDAKEEHKKIIEYYRAKKKPGYQVDLKKADIYGFLYLPKHLYAAQLKDELYDLLTGSLEWMDAKFKACNGDAAYVDDLQLAINDNDFAGSLLSEQLLIFIKLYTARQLIHQRVTTYDDTDLKTLVRLGREAEALNHAMLGSSPKSKFEALLTIHYTLQEKGKLDSNILNEAEKVTGTIIKNSDRIEALNRLAVALTKLKHDNKADEVFSKARKDAYNISENNIEQSSKLLTQLATSLAETGRNKEADNIFTKACEFIGRIDTPLAKIWALQELTIAFAYNGRQKEALDTLSKAEEISNNIKNSHNSPQKLTEVARALVQAGCDKEADKIFTQAQELAYIVDADIDSYQVDALRKLAIALAETGRSNKADEVFSKAEEAAGKIENKLTQVKELNKLAVALTKTKRKQKADEIFIKVQGLINNIEDYRQQAEALCELAISLINGKCTDDWINIFDTAIEAVKEVKKDKELASILSKLGVVLAQTEFIHEANEVFKTVNDVIDEIEDSSQQIKVLKELAAGLSQAKHFKKEAETEFTKAEKIERGTVEDNFTQTLVLSELATALIQAGRTENALAIFTKAKKIANNIKDYRKQALALSQLALTLTQAKHTQQAKEIFTKVEELTSKIENYRERTWVFRGLADALVQAKHTQQARMAFEQAEIAADNIKNDKEKAEELGKLAVTLIDSREFTEGKRVANKIENYLIQVRVLSLLAIALAHANEFTEAEKIANEIENEIENTSSLVSVLSELAVAQTRSKHYKKANNNFNKAGEIVYRVNDCFKYVCALSDLAAALALANKFKKSSYYFSEARKTAGTINNTNIKALSLQYLAAKLAQAGHNLEASEVLTEAKKVAFEIKDKIKRIEILNNLAATLIQIKHFREAFILYFQESSNTLGLKEKPSQFLNDLIKWKLTFEEHEPGLLLNILEQVIRILGRIHSDWCEIDTLLFHRS